MGLFLHLLKWICSSLTVKLSNSPSLQIASEDFLASFCDLSRLISR